jgi:hypothetical protein
MENIPLIESESQEHFANCDFRTKKIHEYRITNNDIVKTKRPKKSFDAGKIFSFLEDVNNPDRTVDDLMLDCVWNKRGNIEIPITAGLLAMFPRADPESIIFAVIGKKKTWGEPIYLSEIESIGVYYLEKEGTEKEAEDDELSIENAKERKQYALPSSYSTHGGDGREHKADKKAETKKPDLRLVPPRKEQKEKAAEHLEPPKEIMDWCKAHYTRGEWKRILRGLHKFCRYRKRREDKYYPGTSEIKNRQYVYGQEWLAGKLRLSRWTVGRWSKRFEDDGIIYIPYWGHKEPKKKVDRGASICELAFTDKHRKKNKRMTGERKTREKQEKGKML